MKLANPRLWEGVAKTNFGHSPLFVWFNKEPMVPEDDQLFKDHPDYAKMFNITYTFKQVKKFPQRFYYKRFYTSRLTFEVAALIVNPRGKTPCSLLFFLGLLI